MLVNVDPVYHPRQRVDHNYSMLVGPRSFVDFFEN
jgi:hypothetical protein